MGRLRNPSDIIGRVFGKLRVVQYNGVVNGKSEYLCECGCGRTLPVRRNDILSGNSTTCGNCTRIVEEIDSLRYFCHHGDSFQFSPCDRDLIEKHRWRINNDGYVVTSVGRKTIRLTHLLCDVPDGYVVDHIDGNPRNNTRENLRIVTVRENNQNALKRSHNKSGYKGVYLAVTKKKYEARIVVDGKGRYLGRYDTEAEAAEAYDEAARLYFGATACVNFPREGERGCRDVA